MARKWLLPVLILFAVYVFSSQGLKSGPQISVPDAAKLMKGEPRPVVIDLRDCAQYEQGHVPGAICVPQAEFKNRLAGLKLPQIDAVILYGADDARVREVTKLLYESGYQGGLTLKGGIDAWRAAGQAVETSSVSAPSR
jgi:rhodanese-related sulfurtransferase